MSTASSPTDYLVDLAKVLIREAIKFKTLFVVLFAITSLSVLLVGAVFPKRFTSETKIFADQQNIIKPLLEGQAPTTKVSDQVRTVKEVVASPRLVKLLVEELGLAQDLSDTLLVDKAVREVLEGLKVQGLGPGFISISYTGSSPTEVYSIVSKITDMFIKDSSESKRRESREAYLFIDKQAKNYKDQLLEAEANLKKFNSSNFDGTEMDAKSRISNLNNEIGLIKLDIEEALTRISSLEKELISETQFVENRFRADEFRSRLSEAQSRLDALRLTYTDDYPDVVALRQQIEDLKKVIRESESPVSMGGASKSNNSSDVNVNPLYEELRKRIATEKVELNTKRRRLDRTQKMLEEEYKRLERIAARQAELAELTRDYDVTKSIYEDMLERKEKARLSMTLDIEGQGVNYRIQEPATFPIHPNGLRFIHFVLAGPLIGFIIPIGLLVVYVQFDPRIRFPSQLEGVTSVPILGVVPHMSTPLAKRIMRSDVILLGIFMIVVLVVYVSLAFAHKSGVL